MRNNLVHPISPNHSVSITLQDTVPKFVKKLNTKLRRIDSLFNNAF